MKIDVLVKPGSRKNEVIEKDGILIIFTNRRAHDGEANRAVIEILSKYYKTPKSQIKIILGEKGRKKVVEIP